MWRCTCCTAEVKRGHVLAALHKQPPWDTSIEERRREAQMVMFGSVESLLKATGTRSEQARGWLLPHCELRFPVAKHRQRLPCQTMARHPVTHSA